VAYDSNNRLAEKLRCEYRNRGEALRGMRAASTSELMARAQMGRDPKVNVSAQAFDDQLRGKTFDYGAGRRNAQSAKNGQRRAEEASRRPYGTRTAAAGERKNTSENPGRRQGDPRKSRRGYAPGAEEIHRVRFAEMDAEEEVFEEIRVERKRMPRSFLVILAFSTIMIMLIIMSVAQIYQTTREVSTLEDTVEELKETIDELELKLDEKNDIRLIEQMATMEMGMVKEDSLQRKYISLSDGERVDLIETAAEAEENGAGTMLSSIFSVFSDLFEYFR